MLLKIDKKISGTSILKRLEFILDFYLTVFIELTPTLSAWLLRSHWALKSILREIIFLDQLHDFSLLSLNSSLQPFLKSKFM